ncbi:MAG: recombination protein RecR [Candidatus Aureabacteria bacterium]|nr:recombination protein RecR [Candidatus Auribacterota bacterium]
MQKVIDWLSSLPGMGRKSAERAVIHLLDLPGKSLRDFAGDILEMEKSIHRCSLCGNYAEASLCGICQDKERDGRLLCLVEQPRDTALFEKSSKFKGRYHILGGKLSPLDGIGPDELNLKSLKDRVEKESITEIIIATSADVEGEATADYILDMFRDKGDIQLSRIGFGIPYGATLDFVSTQSIEKALQNRVPLRRQ